MKMPMLIANRSLVSCVYNLTSGDSKVLIHSSLGNEDIVKSIKAQIGKDVVARNIVTYMSWQPYEGGLELHWLSKMDPAGYIPKFVK